MIAFLRKIRRAVSRPVRQWLDCRFKRCDYYRHYLAYGPAELTHEGYHAAERRCLGAQQRWEKHLQTCHHNGNEKACGTCQVLGREAITWEHRVRA